MDNLYLWLRWDEMPDDDPRALAQALNELAEMGIVTVTGITPDGQWLYTLSDYGRDLYRQFTGQDPPALPGDSEDED